MALDVMLDQERARILAAFEKSLAETAEAFEALAAASAELYRAIDRQLELLRG